MIKIIETNISYNGQDEFSDHQSRVILHNSWEDYIEEIKNCESKDHEGTMLGCSLPKECIIKNLNYDNKHLRCEVYRYDDTRFFKMAYLIENDSILRYN